MSKYVVMGGGVAGVTAARTLAERVSDQDEIHVLDTKATALDRAALAR